MPKKKTHHRKAKHKNHDHAAPGFGPDIGGHHARLRKLHASHGHRSGGQPGAHHRKGRKKAAKHHAKPRKSSALMERLRSAAAGARDQIKSFGRRKAARAEKPVTEQTLRHQMALKCVRRCSH
jgi:hypothetical protein